MVRISLLAPLGVALLAAACARHALVEPDRIGSGYTVGGGEWNTGGGITVMVRAVERNGATVICGAWTMDRQSTVSILYNDDVIQAGSIFLDGRRAVQNLSFMPQLRYAADLTGRPAACVASKLPWQDSFAQTVPKVALPRMRFADDELYGSAVQFRPGPRPRPLP